MEPAIEQRTGSRHENDCYYHVTYEFQSESGLFSLPECQGTPCSKQVP